MTRARRVVCAIRTTGATVGGHDARETASAVPWPLTLLVTLALAALAPAAHAHDDATRAEAASTGPRLEPVRPYPLDRSGRRQVGKASYYDDYFFGRKMANGEPMQPESNNAASKTLPLGTKAQVRNLENGRTAVVEIKDRGPYVEGRIVDVSPSTAAELGILEQGVARVEVKPIALPPGPPANGAESRRSAREEKEGDSEEVATAEEVAKSDREKAATSDGEKAAKTRGARVATADDE